MTNTYQIQYTDNTYRVVDWTEEEFEKVSEYMEAEARVISLDGGIFRLTDIRAIVLVPEIEQEEVPQDESELSDWGFVDPQTAEWLRAQGIDVRGKSK